MGTKHGTPAVTKVLDGMTEDKNLCWIPKAPPNPVDGYVQVRDQGKIVRAHRVVYEAWYGPIPEGIQIDHLCRNRRCVKPYHLEALTQEEHIRRTDVSNGGRRIRRR